MSHAINTTNVEDKAYRVWEREEKNRILNIQNTERKQTLWREKFGTKQEPDDSYLLGNVF